MNLEFPEFRLKFNEKPHQFYWEGIKEFNSVVYYLRIIYPHEFATIQPSVFVAEDESFSKLLSFNNSIHRLINGSICLYPWDYGEHGWKTNYSVVNVINKFLDFIDLFEKQAIPQNHFSTPVEGFIKVAAGIVLSLKDFSSFYKYRRGNFHAIFDPATNLYIVQKIHYLSDTLKEKTTILFKYTPLIPLPPFVLSWFVVSNSTLQKIKQLYNKDELVTFLKSKYRSWVLTDFRPPVLFIAINKKNEFDTHCIANLLNIPRLEVVDVYFGSIEAESVKRTKEVLNIDIKSFDSYLLCFIGVGSLGSEIALQLVKAGFKNLILVDPDVLEPSNLSRHVLDIRSLHRNKAQAMAMNLSAKNFGVRINSYPTSILAPDIIDSISDRTKKVNKKLILICTTNDLESEHFINNIAIREKITTFFASCSVRVEMGRIFRVIPKITPCYYCISLEMQTDSSKMAFHENSADWEFAPYSQGIPGIGFDVSIVGNITSKLILETLMDEIDENHTYKSIQSDHVIISLLKQQNLSIGVYEQYFTINPTCPICSDSVPEEEYLNEIEKLKLNQ